MENATHALIMAFSVMVLVIALTVSIAAFTNARQTADAILYTKDETNYYEYQGTRGKQSENRIVGLETVIPTLYKYYKENYTVVFKQGNYNETTGEISNWSYMTIYKTKSNSRNWQGSYEGLMQRKYDVKKTNEEIFSFDLDEETLRHEPWTGSNDRIKNNLDCFLSGETYYNPNNNSEYIKYGEVIGNGGFTEKYKNSKFIETIQEYTYNSSQTTNSTIGSLTKEKSKRMIIFTKIN